jgi:hypothetical protein
MGRWSYQQQQRQQGDVWGANAEERAAATARGEESFVLRDAVIRLFLWRTQGNASRGICLKLFGKYAEGCGPRLAAATGTTTHAE